jgi:hypothetical protein
MRILSLQKSDGIGECPLTCENFFKLLWCKHLSLDLRWNRDPAFPWNRIIRSTTAELPKKSLIFSFFWSARCESLQLINLRPAHFIPIYFSSGKKHLPMSEFWWCLTAGNAERVACVWATTS